MFLTVDALSKELGIHPKSIRRLAKEHKIPAGKVGGSWVFIREDVESKIRADYDGGVHGGLRKSTGDNKCAFLNKQADSDSMYATDHPDQTNHELESLRGLLKARKEKSYS